MLSESCGDYLQYHLDWNKGEMTLLDTGGCLRDNRNISVGAVTQLSPLAHSMQQLVLKNGGVPSRVIIDAEYDGKILLLRLHCTDNFHSVVNVDGELMTEILGGEFTPREMQVAILLFDGRTIRYIASRLQIAEGTVKRILHNVYQKLNVACQGEFVHEVYVRLAQYAAQCESG